MGNSDLGETNFVGKRKKNIADVKILIIIGVGFYMNQEVEFLNTKYREKLQTRKHNKSFVRNPFLMS
jgi:stalled ribosome rescue protein Dom34